MTKIKKQIFQISGRKYFKTVLVLRIPSKKYIKTAIYVYEYLYLYCVWTVLSIIRNDKKNNYKKYKNKNNNNNTNKIKIKLIKNN